MQIKRFSIFAVTIVAMLVLSCLGFLAGRKYNREEYRNYAAGQLRGEILAELVTVGNLVGNSPADAALAKRIGDSFIVLDAKRQSLRNIYVPEKLGTLSESHGVWFALGVKMLSLAEQTDPSPETEAFLSSLKVICDGSIPAFEGEMGGVSDFEYELKTLEDKLKDLTNK